jgi:GrpB-like predicted nucleotidyltransferase (UPF0157 family)
LPELDEPIPLCAYKPQWPVLFTSEAVQLRAALPVDIAIEHIGSTAVPGLLAKPIIDIMIGAEPHHGVDGLRSKLAALGYEDMDLL